MYRKKTHTYQYLSFASHHPFEHKLSVVRILLHQADTVVREPEDKAEEISHVKEALQNCGYGEWAVFCFFVLFCLFVCLFVLGGDPRRKQAASAAVMLTLVNICLPHFLVCRACQKSWKEPSSRLESVLPLNLWTPSEKP